MSTSIATAHASTKVSNTPQFWGRLWRTAGVQSIGLFIVAYFVYGNQPHIGASVDALVAFYQADRMRILIATVLGGFAVLNLMWFAAALRTTLADAGQDGWGAAATASSAALGGLLMLLITVSAALSYSIAGSGNTSLLGGLNDFAWAGVVLSSFPRAMLIMSAAFGLWRARLISNGLFSLGVAAVVARIAAYLRVVAHGGQPRPFEPQSDQCRVVIETNHRDVERGSVKPPREIHRNS
jgi:hypothetical protein